jgi:signal transduction histidine kinase
MTQTDGDMDTTRPLRDRRRIRIGKLRSTKEELGIDRDVTLQSDSTVLRSRWRRRGSPREHFSQETLRTLPVFAPVLAVGSAVTAAAVRTLVTSNPEASLLVGAATLLAAAVIAEAFPVRIEGVAVGRTSLATVFIVGAAVIYGWSVAVPIAALATAIVEVAGRAPFIRTTYNIAVYALAAAAAGAVADALEGPELDALVLATLLSSAAFYLLDITLIAVVVARYSGEETWGLLGRFVYRTLVPWAVMACLAVILVVVWDRSPFVALALAAPLASLVLYERWMHEFRRLRDVDRLKDEFVAVVSHELRTPLASVYGAAMTLQRDELDPRTRESLLTIIYDESARLARLVDQVLWASRLEADRAEVVIEAVDPLPLSEEVVAAARTHLPAGLTLELAVEPDLPDVAGDGEKIKQVLVNLVENAVKYSPDGGRIELSVASTNDHVQFSVRDEGLGIPASEQERVFEKFHRLDPNLTRGVSGTGLGLYICRQLVERMGGRIWVASELGVGSTFSFELPLLQDFSAAHGGH